MATLVAFIAVSAIVICTPGQDTALTIRNTLTGGRGSGVATAGGVAAGQAAWTIAASAGVVALLTASEPVFRALKLAGAAYLVFLGAQALWGRPRAPYTRAHAADMGSPLVESRISAGRPLEPREPEDGGVLREPAAAVRA